MILDEFLHSWHPKFQKLEKQGPEPSILAATKVETTFEPRMQLADPRW